MIVDYEISFKNRPSEREVWLMSKRAQEAGFNISMALMRHMEKGEVKYHDGKLYRLCKHCLDYLEFDEFYENSRSALKIYGVCKKCTSTRNRIKKWGMVGQVNDAGMKHKDMAGVINRLSDVNREILGRKGGADEHTFEEDI